MSQPPGQSPGQPRLQALQALRALAAVMVMVSHVIGEVEDRVGAGPLPWIGGLPLPLIWGVDLFFVISGAVIVLSAAREAGRPGGWRRFLAARAIRIVPLYWIFTALMLGVLVLMPQHVYSVALNWGQVAASFVFLPYRTPTGFDGPILPPGWTLNYEAFFYVAMALLLASGARIGMVVWALAGIFAVIALTGWIARPEVTVLRVWSQPLILEFAFGALIGLARLRLRGRVLARGALVPVGLTLAGLVALWFGYGLFVHGVLPRWLAGGVPAAVLVATAVLFTDRATDTALPRWMVALGDSSYALYLSHRFTMRAVTLVWPEGLAAWSYVALAAGASIGAAHAVFLFVERPLLRRLRARLLAR